MASSTATPAEPRPQTVAKTVEYEAFVDQRIQQTRGAVKLADLATGVVTLLAWTLFVLLLAAVADHWLVAGGFTRTGRFALFGIGAIGGLLYVATRLAPKLLGRVNPLYAAQEIEKETPELKNSVLNFLQLRDHPASAAAVRQTLQRQAAERLAAAGEASIDRTPLLRAAKVVLALVAMIGVYVVASPKDFFASAGRVLAPWADIAPPSRVQFDEVTPGDQKLAQGERLEIGSMVSGLRDDELVEVVFTTSDGRAVERRTPMRASETGVHHTATLPAGGGAAAALGLQGDLQYRLEAGDARTRNYRVEVIAAPTIAPAIVRYEYPRYTGYTNRDVEGVGDLRAIEGTRVTLTAAANLPIESAQIDLGADGRPDVRMQADGTAAIGDFVLRRDPSQPGDSVTSYVLRFTATDGQANHSPPQYRVEVIADLAPEVRIESPEEAVLQVRANERVFVTVTARDPDFALARLRLIGESQGRRVLEEDLLQDATSGKVEGEGRILPEKLGLRPGDTLDYWVEAADNRTPEPNLTVSTRKQLLIFEPAEGEQQGEHGGESGQGSPDAGAPQEDRNQQPGQPGQPGQQGGSQSADQDNQTGENPSGKNQPGQNPNESPQQEQQEGEGREPSPNGLRAPGEGGQTGDQESESDSAGNSGGDPGDGEEQSGNQTGASAAEQPSDPSSTEKSSDEQSGEQQRPSGGEPNESGQEGAGESDTPTARDGSDDGSAFEKMLDYLKNQDQGAWGDQQNDAGQDSPQSGDPGDDGQSEETPPSNGEQGSPDESETGGGGGQSRDPADGGSGGGAKDNNAGGADSQGGSRGERGDAPQTEGSEDGPGAGEQDREGDASDSANSEPGGESPPGQESDPRAGPREGTGDSGQNQAADQGAGRSGDEGAGESTGQEGGQEESDGSTGGQPDDRRRGDGEPRPSETGQESPGGERSGDASQQDGQGQSANDSAGEAAGDRQADAEGEPLKEGEGPDSPVDRRGEGPDGPAGENSGDPVGVGDRGPDTSGAGAGTEPGGDAANLDYTRKQTDLVLKQLEDQLRKQQVDPELLDRLGWTEQDVRRFLERWKTRKQRAAQQGAEGQAELDRALRSLGINQQGATGARTITAERLKELRQGARQKTPPRLQEQLELFNRSLNATPSEE